MDRNEQWERTIFLAGFQAGKIDANTHPGGYQDPWEGGHGSRAELAYQQWKSGQLQTVAVCK